MGRRAEKSMDTHTSMEEKIRYLLSVLVQSLHAANVFCQKKPAQCIQLYGTFAKEALYNCSKQ